MKKVLLAVFGLPALTALLALVIMGEFAVEVICNLDILISEFSCVLLIEILGLRVETLMDILFSIAEFGTWVNSMTVS